MTDVPSLFARRSVAVLFGRTLQLLQHGTPWEGSCSRILQNATKNGVWNANLTPVSAQSPEVPIWDILEFVEAELELPVKVGCG